jgi:hypothetical protein
LSKLANCRIFVEWDISSHKINLLSHKSCRCYKIEKKIFKYTEKNKNKEVQTSDVFEEIAIEFGNHVNDFSP